MMTTNNATSFSYQEYLVLDILNDCKKHTAKDLASKTMIRVERTQGIIRQLILKGVIINKIYIDSKINYYLNNPHPLPSNPPQKSRYKCSILRQIEIDLIQLLNTGQAYRTEEIIKILATDRDTFYRSLKYLKIQGYDIKARQIGRNRFEFYTTQVYDLAQYGYTSTLVIPQTDNKKDKEQTLENKIQQLQEEITKEFSFEKCRELSRLTIKLESFRLRPAPTEEIATNNIRIINNEVSHF